MCAKTLVELCKNFGGVEMRGTIDNACHVDCDRKDHRTVCHKQLSLLFNNAECLFLKPRLVVPEDLIMMRTPRNNNAYVVVMNDPEIKASMTCLLSKASDSESLLWHRRLDDFTRYSWVNFLACKDETVEVLKSLILKIEKIFKRLVISIRSDNGTEFKNLVEAVNTTKYVLNRSLVVKAHNKTAYELFHARKPLIEFFRTFGCSSTLLNTAENLAKFGAVGDEFYFFEYSSSQKAYRVYNKRTNIMQEYPLSVSVNSIVTSSHSEATETALVNYSGDACSGLQCCSSRSELGT
ncbi:hypothetical protein L1987_18616 [Smallanthus sonchifolius]|uniref:Uncharacterized protein n=1 Tax=Smallanthus sonchifolius TaxID=185202 RepID=A0ACB9J2A1_9ASTR|nr:hypothetical protein L1987_18616 [Smallanthus sonchifolius]